MRLYLVAIYSTVRVFASFADSSEQRESRTYRHGSMAVYTANLSEASPGCVEQSLTLQSSDRYLSCFILTEYCCVQYFII